MLFIYSSSANCILTHKWRVKIIYIIIVMHIAIAGNIGSGKTTLTDKLAKHYGYEVLLEKMDSNPYINSFYEDMRRWSFNLQIYYLHTRYKQLLEMKQRGCDFVQDRTLYEDAYIFAPNLQAMGLMNSRDYDNYIAVFELLESFVQPPDLLIYLHGEVPSLIKQIQKTFHFGELSKYIQKFFLHVQLILF